MDVIFCENELLTDCWKPDANLWHQQSPGQSCGAQLEPQLNPPTITDHLYLLFFFSSSTLLSSPSFFPTGLWAPLVALLAPVSPPLWRGGGQWSGAWVGATTPHPRRQSGSAGTSTRCRWWCVTSWSPATSAWSCWPHLRWDSPSSCSSTIVRWWILTTNLLLHFVTNGGIVQYNTWALLHCFQSCNYWYIWDYFVLF